MKDIKKKTPELSSQVPSFPTLLKGWVSEICWICKITSLSTAQVTVYPCLSFPFSTYEHQFVFRRSNMPAECIFLTTGTPSLDFYRRSKYLVDIMDKLSLPTSGNAVYNHAQSIFVSIFNLNQTDQQNPTRSIDIARPEIYVYVL